MFYLDLEDLKPRKSDREKERKEKREKKEKKIQDNFIISPDKLIHLLICYCFSECLWSTLYQIFPPQHRLHYRMLTSKITYFKSENQKSQQSFDPVKIWVNKSYTNLTKLSFLFTAWLKLI